MLALCIIVGLLGFAIWVTLAGIERSVDAYRMEEHKRWSENRHPGSTDLTPYSSMTAEPLHSVPDGGIHDH